MARAQRLAAASGAVVLSLTLAACGGHDMDGMGSSASPSSSSSPSSSGDGGSASVDAAHNEADTTFAQGMIIHHRGAVEMADLAVEKAESPEVRALAERISAAQGPEIETMSSWLEAWGEEVPEGASMDGMDHSGMEGMGMGGMDTEESMSMLEGVSGAEFDRMFLEMMVEHHQGAVEMAQTQQADGENPQAVELAATIEADQSAEIQEMQDLLTQVG